MFMFCFVLFHIKSLCFFSLFVLHCKTTIELPRVGQLTNVVHLPSMRTVGCSNPGRNRTGLNVTSPRKVDLRNGHIHSGHH